MAYIHLLYLSSSKLRQEVTQTGSDLAKTPGVPFTLSSVVTTVRDVKGGWRLAWNFYIPWSNWSEIMHSFSDEMEQKKQAIQYWMNCDPLAGWRRLITALDEMGETQLADSIISNAEPLTGSQVCSYQLPVHVSHTCRCVRPWQHQYSCRSFFDTCLHGHCFAVQCVHVPCVCVCVYGLCVVNLWTYVYVHVSIVHTHVYVHVYFECSLI